jgi:hypothetical protein
MMIKVIVCLGDGNQSRCKLIGLPPDRRVRTNNAS